MKKVGIMDTVTEIIKLIIIGYFFRRALTLHRELSIDLRDRISAGTASLKYYLVLPVPTTASPVSSRPQVNLQPGGVPWGRLRLKVLQKLPRKNNENNKTNGQSAENRRHRECRDV